MANSKVVLHRLGVRNSPDSIEPSCGVMDVVENGAVKYRIVIDCGLTQIPLPGGPRKLHYPDFSLFNDGKKIDAVLITHVHADHFGAVTKLLPFMSREARVVMTKGSFTVAMHVLKDNAIGLDKAGQQRVLFENGEISRRALIIRKPGEVEILHGIPALVWPAGHIQGACSFTLKVGKLKIHYAGDRCTHDQPGIKGAPPLPPEWRPDVFAGTDCTYGADPDSDKRVYRDEWDRGTELAKQALLRGSSVAVPAFALHRSAAVAHMFQQAGIGDFGRLLLDGKAELYTDIMETGEGHWWPGDEAIDATEVERVSERYMGGAEDGESRYEIARNGNFTIVTTAGMGGPGGPFTQWRKFLLSDPDALILFSGYVAPDTDGAKILAAARERDATGNEIEVTFDVLKRDRTHKGRLIKGGWVKETYPVKCHVAQMRIGGHESRGKTLDWFQELRPQAAVLAHGSEASLASLAGELRGVIPLLHGSHDGPLTLDA
ncbi:MBL fold metallo-hydrolase [Candidatus Uhrbacteria bacterium]|nr:MBL fold metallo-hydrolase [Candidatus Uhrbacteria bacterium]